MKFKLPEGLPGGRKFWLALVGAVVAFGNGYWDWGLDVSQVFQVLSPLLAFIFAEGAADVVSRLKGK